MQVPFGSAVTTPVPAVYVNVLPPVPVRQKVPLVPTTWVEPQSPGIAVDIMRA